MVYWKMQSSLGFLLRSLSCVASGSSGFMFSWFCSLLVSLFLPCPILLQNVFPSHPMFFIPLASFVLNHTSIFWPMLPPLPAFLFTPSYSFFTHILSLFLLFPLVVMSLCTSSLWVPVHCSFCLYPFPSWLLYFYLHISNTLNHWAMHKTFFLYRQNPVS